MEVQEPVFPEVQKPDRAAGPGDQIDVLLNTSLPISVCLGQMEIDVQELLELGPGSVLMLTKKVGEPVELQLNQNCFATGHVVVASDQIGVQIGEILAPQKTE